YHFSLGQQARLSGDVTEALQEYRKAQKLDPSAGEVRAEIARLLQEAGRLDEAVAEAKEAVRLSGNSPEAHLALAQLYRTKAEGDGGEESLKSAAAEYEEVLRIRPTDGQTMLALAEVYRQLNEPKEGARAWQRYLELDPGSFEGFLQLGAQYLALGDSD